MIRLAGLLTIAMGLLAGCGAPALQPAVPTPTPTPVAVPIVPDTIRSKLLLEDPQLVIKQSEQQPLAPDTFAIIGNQVILDDFLTDKFAIYQGGKRITDFAEPVAVVDMAIRDDKVYLLDTESTVTIYTRTAKGLKQIRKIKLRVPDPGTESVYNSLYFEGPNLIAEADAKVLADGPGPVLDDPEDTELDHAFHLTDGNINAIVPFKYDRYGVKRIALTDQYVFYKVSDIADTGSKNDPFEESVLQFTLDGQLIHTYRVHLETDAGLHREFVVNDGKLYQMWISTKTVKVFLIEPND